MSKDNKNSKETNNQEVKSMSDESSKVEKTTSIPENNKAKTRQSQIRESLRRGTFEESGRLSFTIKNEDKDYVYRVVNDTTGNINKKLNQGYEFVEGSDIEYDSNIDMDNPTGVGSKAQLEVGKDKGSVKAYVMRCPKDIYDGRKKADRKSEKDRFKNAVKENQHPHQNDPSSN